MTMINHEGQCYYGSSWDYGGPTDQHVWNKYQ